MLPRLLDVTNACKRRATVVGAEEKPGVTSTTPSACSQLMLDDEQTSQEAKEAIVKRALGLLMMNKRRKTGDRSGLASLKSIADR